MDKNLIRICVNIRIFTKFLELVKNKTLKFILKPKLPIKFNRKTVTPNLKIMSIVLLQKNNETTIKYSNLTEV